VGREQLIGMKWVKEVGVQYKWNAIEKDSNVGCFTA